MTTDEKRLQQIIKNLLSNAFKFTHEGGVVLSIRRASGGWNPAQPAAERRGRRWSRTRSPIPASAFPATSCA